MIEIKTRTELVDLDRLAEYPGNPRRGDKEAIKASLSENGQFQPLVVQESSGTVLTGNHTFQCMRELGWEQAEVKWVDVDDHAARKIMLAANRTGDKATYDDRELVLAIEALEGDLDGSGFDDTDLDELADSDPEPEPVPAPPPSIVGAVFSDAPAPGIPGQRAPGSAPAEADGGTGATTLAGVVTPVGSNATKPVLSGPDADPLVQVQWLLTEPQRETVTTALALAQQVFEQPTRAAALAALCGDFLNSRKDEAA